MTDPDTNTLTAQEQISQWISERPSAPSMSWIPPERRGSPGVADLSGRGVEVVLEILESLDTANSVSDILDLLPSLAVPALSRWCTVNLVGGNGEFRHFSIAHEEPEFLANHEDSIMFRVRPDEIKDTLLYSLLTGSAGPTLMANVTREYLTETCGEELGEAVFAFGTTSLIAVPIQAGSAGVAALVLFAGPERPPYTQADFEFACAFGTRVSALIGRTEDVAARREYAMSLQQSLLPVPDSPDGMEVAVTYMPATKGRSLGGDWYDVVRLSSGAVSISIGDVMGHDTAAAVYMGRITAAMRAYSWLLERPAIILEKLDAMARATDAHSLAATCMTVTLTVHPDGSASAISARAGHPPAIVRLPDGSTTCVMSPASTPIGIRWPHASRPESTWTVPMGTVVVMYTDGLLERRGVGLSEQIEGLRQFVASMPAGLPVEQMANDIIDRFTGDVLDDDVCLLLFRLAKPSSPAFNS